MLENLLQELLLQEQSTFTYLFVPERIRNVAKHYQEIPPFDVTGNDFWLKLLFSRPEDDDWHKMCDHVSFSCEEPLRSLQDSERDHATLCARGKIILQTIEGNGPEEFRQHASFIKEL